MIEFARTSRTSYLIDENGIVISIRYNKIRKLKLFVDNRGYKTVDINRKKINVHIIVAEIFIGPRPIRKVINHIDGNKLNNSFLNLEYVSSKENSVHAVCTGLCVGYDKRKMSKIKARTCVILKKLGLSNRSLSKIYKIAPSHMSRITRGLSW